MLPQLPHGPRRSVETGRPQTREPAQIDGVGKAYAAKIELWQKTANFADETEWVGDMIIADARRLLELMRQIQQLETISESVAATSMIATTLRTITGFGLI